MVARYGYSPSIGMWEFFNEIDNVMYHGTPENHIPDSVITQWHSEMSAYLNEIDSYQHIITTSVSHRDVTGMNAISNIDINQRHIYRHTNDIPTLLSQYSTAFNKPYVIGEFGYEWDWSKNFDDFAVEMDSDFKRGLWLGLFNPTPVLPMSWWWEYFENRGLIPYFNRIKEIHEKMMVSETTILQAFTPKVSSEVVLTQGVKNEKNSFIYVNNTRSKKTSVEILIPDYVLSTNSTITVFDCESGSYSKLSVEHVTISRNIVRLELQIKQDVVLIF